MLRRRVGDAISRAEHITLTCDLWTHKNTMRSYLGVTAHFADDTEMPSYELGAKLVEKRKTIANLRAALLEICEAWQINYERVVALVTDGGSNIKGAVKEEFGSDKHPSCFAHQLNSIGQKVIGLREETPAPSEQEEPQAEVPEGESDDEDDDAVDQEAVATGSLKDLLIKVKRIVRFFRQREVATSKLLALQTEEMQKSEGQCRKLVQEVRTRWNSCYDMVDRYLSLSHLVTRVILSIQREKCSKSKPPAILLAEEEEALRDVRDILKPFARVTKEVSAEKHATLSKCIPLIKNLNRDIEIFVPSTSVGSTLKKKLCECIHLQFGRIEEVKMYAAACLLDPRFKKAGFSVNEKSPIIVANAISNVSNLVKQKMKESKDAELPVPSESPEAIQPEDDDVWGSFDKELQEHVKNCSGQDVAGGIPVQFRTFLDSPPVNRLSNPNPLQTWEALKGEYKYVYPVARKYLSILAIFVPSERLFSHAGLIASQLRTRLSGKHLEMLVFLRSYEESLWFL